LMSSNEKIVFTFFVKAEMAAAPISFEVPASVVDVSTAVAAVSAAALMSVKGVVVRGLPRCGDTKPFATKNVEEKKRREVIDVYFILTLSVEQYCNEFPK
jgi:hypothetical protein